MLRGDPKQRPSPSQLVERLSVKGMPFSGELVQTAVFLENIALRDMSDKDAFFRKLNDVVEGFPPAFNHHRVLPELIKALEFGAGAPGRSARRGRVSR